MGVATVGAMNTGPAPAPLSQLVRGKLAIEITIASVMAAMFHRFEKLIIQFLLVECKNIKDGLF